MNHESYLSASERRLTRVKLELCIFLHFGAKNVTQQLNLLQRASWTRVRLRPRNLVDPASSHMLVSKIKPCMSQYQHFHS